MTGETAGAIRDARCGMRDTRCGLPVARGGLPPSLWDPSERVRSLPSAWAPFGGKARGQAPPVPRRSHPIGKQWFAWNSVHGYLRAVTAAEPRRGGVQPEQGVRPWPMWDVRCGMWARPSSTSCSLPRRSLAKAGGRSTESATESGSRPPCSTSVPRRSLPRPPPGAVLPRRLGRTAATRGRLGRGIRPTPCGGTGEGVSEQSDASDGPAAAKRLREAGSETGAFRAL